MIVMSWDGHVFSLCRVMKFLLVSIIGVECVVPSPSFLALSSHWGLWTLILITDTQETQIHWWVEHNIFMATLLHKFIHALEQGFHHLAARGMISRFGVASVSVTSRPSMETIKGESIGVAGDMHPGTSVTPMLRSKETFL